MEGGRVGVRMRMCSDRRCRLKQGGGLGRSLEDFALLKEALEIPELDGEGEQHDNDRDDPNDDHFNGGCICQMFLIIVGVAEIGHLFVDLRCHIRRPLQVHLDWLEVVLLCPPYLLLRFVFFGFDTLFQLEADVNVLSVLVLNTQRKSASVQCRKEELV
jgi:hypothetical protein